MSYWFYQINQENWEPERFRIEIWENERWRYGVGRLMGSDRPKSGDSVAFFYAKAHGPDPGFYAWAVVLEYYEKESDEKFLYFRPVAPTNHLKMHPWWNGEAENLANELRGAVYQATLWKVSEGHWGRIRSGITAWVGGAKIPCPATSAP